MSRLNWKVGLVTTFADRQARVCASEFLGNASSLSRRIVAWRAFTTVVAALGLAAVVQSAEAQILPFAPYSLAPQAEDVIGDLGGVPVRIPRQWVRLVEYAGDSHWLEKQPYPPPARTYGSKLTSFAILIHMPTMKALTPENYEAYQKRGFRDLEWISGGVEAAVLPLTSWTPLNWENPYTWKLPGQGRGGYQSYDYTPLPDRYGLKGWRAVRWNPGNLVLDDKDRGQGMMNHHLYFAYQGGRIVAVIRCGSGVTSAPGGRHTCDHSFLLYPEMKAEVSLSYSPESLAQWRTYQDAMRELILSWRTVTSAKR